MQFGIGLMIYCFEKRRGTRAVSFIESLSFFFLWGANFKEGYTYLAALFIGMLHFSFER